MAEKFAVGFERSGLLVVGDAECFGEAANAEGRLGDAAVVEAVDVPEQSEGVAVPDGGECECVFSVACVGHDLHAAT